MKLVRIIFYYRNNEGNELKLTQVELIAFFYFRRVRFVLVYESNCLHEGSGTKGGCPPCVCVCVGGPF